MSKKKALLKPKSSSGALNLNQRLIKDAAIKKNIVILDELRDLIPALQGEERRQLSDNIKTEGCREPLILWERSESEYILVDGHNRYSICTEHGVNFNIRLKEFDSMEAVKDFMIDNQLGRRNLTPEMASYLRGLKYERYKVKENNTSNLKQFSTEGHKMSTPGNGAQQSAGDGTQDTGGHKMSTSGKTADKLAKEYNVSRETIKRDHAFAKGLDMIGETNPQLKQDIISGRVKPKKSDVQLIGKKAPAATNLEKIDDIAALAQRLKGKTEKVAEEASNPNGKDTGNPFSGRKLMAADVMHYTLLVAEKYPGELKDTGNQKKDLQQLQKLAFKALNEADSKQEGSWLQKALEKEINAL